jgi:hypothetical protein
MMAWVFAGDQKVAVGIEHHGNLKKDFSGILRGVDQRGEAGDGGLVGALQGGLQAVPGGHGGKRKSAVLADGGNAHGQHGRIVIVHQSAKTRELVGDEAFKVHSVACEFVEYERELQIPLR